MASERGVGIAGAMDYEPRKSIVVRHLCFVCGAEFKGGASYGARCAPPLIQACSAACFNDPRFRQTASGMDADGRSK